MLATTIRLWAERRGLWSAGRARPSRRGWQAAVALLGGIVLVAGAVTLATTGSPAPHARQPKQARSTPSAVATQSAAALAAAATARQQAAQWVAQQVSPGTIVSCDPAMCAAQQAAGTPAAELLVLRPGQTDLLGSGIVIATAAVNNEFGSRLATVYAPVTLAAFGTGQARVAVRVVAPDGARSYLASLATDLHQRKLAGAQLLHDSHLRVSSLARRQLAAGQVDSRLLVTLAALANVHPVDVLNFGVGAEPGASPGVPLRSADIVPATLRRRRAARHQTAQALRAFLRAQRPPFRPFALTLMPGQGRRTVLQVAFPGPSPLGLLGTTPARRR